VILIIILNAVFAAFVLVSIVGLHLYAIAKDRSEHAQGALVATATDGPPERHRTLERRRMARRVTGAVSARRGRNQPSPALNI
jgi:hypothetical protein